VTTELENLELTVNLTSVMGAPGPALGNEYGENFTFTFPVTVNGVKALTSAVE